MYWAPGMTIRSIEETFVVEALKFYAGNEQSAANSLGITVVQLQDITKRTELNAKEQAERDAERQRKGADFLARSRGLVYRDPETLMDTVMPFPAGQTPGNPVGGLGGNEAAVVLGAPKTIAPPVPAVAVLPTVGTAPAGDPVAAAEATKRAMASLETPVEVFPE